MKYAGTVLKSYILSISPKFGLNMIKSRNPMWNHKTASRGLCTTVQIAAWSVEANK